MKEGPEGQGTRSSEGGSTSIEQSSVGGAIKLHARTRACVPLPRKPMSVQNKRESIGLPTPAQEQVLTDCV